MTAALAGGFSVKVPRTVSPTLGSDGLQISFATVSGVTYQHQNSGDLITWTNLGNHAAGDGNVWSTSMAVTNDPAGFFRLQAAGKPTTPNPR